MEYNNVRLEQENFVATLRLNRPDALNALSPELLEEFSHAVLSVSQDEAVKVLVVRGEGRAFCAGADLLFLESILDDLAQLPPYIQRLNDCFFQLEELPIPTIALVHGFALAGGLELMMACDLAIVAEDSRLGDQHANFGLIPGGGSTQRLPRRVGMQRAMELLTTGSWISGGQAVDWGLALRAVPAPRAGPGTGAASGFSAHEKPSRVGMDQVHHPAGSRFTPAGWSCLRKPGLRSALRNFHSPQRGHRGLSRETPAGVLASPGVGLVT